MRRDDELVRTNLDKSIELPIILNLLELAKERPILEKYVVKKRLSSHFYYCSAMTNP